MIYYTSDLHIGHSRILKYCPNRPWQTVKEMDQGLIENWNNLIKDDDHVYILGDISFKKTIFEETMIRLNGFKHIILGNHDPENVHKQKMHKTFFHMPIHEIKDQGRSVIMCHYPIYEWNHYYRNAVHFHGHTHGTIGKSFRPNAFDVGVDVQGYIPRTYDEIVNSVSDVSSEGNKTGGILP